MKRYQLAKFLFSLATVSYAGLASAEDLLEVYSMAISSDPTLQGAYAQRMATREALPSALAGFLPGINANAQLNSSDSDYEATLGNISGFPTLPTQTIDRNYQGNLIMSQTLFNMATWHTFKQAKETVSYADANYMASEQDLIIRTSTAYFNLLAALDNLAFVQAEKEAVNRQLDQTNEKFNVGLVAITDVKDLQARYDASSAEEIAALNNVGNLRQQLKILTGVLVEQVDGLQQLPLTSPEPADDSEWVEMADQYNPTLQAAKYQANAAEIGVKVAKDQHLPTIEYNAGYGKIRAGSPDDPIGDWAMQWNSNVVGSISVFNGGAIQSNVRKAQYEHMSVKQQLEQVNRDTETATRNAFRNVISAIGQVNAFTRAVDSANASLEATSAGYDVGTRTSVDLLAAISNLYQQESSLATARYNYILAILQLKQAAGTLNTDDVYAVNQWLQPGSTQAAEIIKSVPGASGTAADKNVNNYMDNAQH